MLAEFFYAEGPGPTVIDRTRASLESTLRALLACEDLWTRVAGASPEDVYLLDPFWSFRLARTDTRVYASPDLVVRARGETMWEVIDFKVGRTDGVIDQLLTYGVALRRGVELDVMEGLIGRVVSLGDVPHERELRAHLAPVDLDDAEERIAASIAEMRGNTADARRNLPRPPDVFRGVADPSACRTCQFRGQCYPALLPRLDVAELDESLDLASAGGSPPGWD
jgi:predicted RecB family nuclease